MKDIFENTTTDEIIGRIENLPPDITARWGKMNVSQMLKHCNEVLMVAMGKKKVKRNIFGVLFGKMVLKSIVKNDKPLKKNAPTAPEFTIKETPDFHKAKMELISTIHELQQKSAQDFENFRHPFFGRLTSQQWNILQYKHLDHHLRQFGA